MDTDEYVLIIGEKIEVTTVENIRNRYEEFRENHNKNIEMYGYSINRDYWVRFKEIEDEVKSGEYIGWAVAFASEVPKEVKTKLLLITK